MLNTLQTLLQFIFNAIKNLLGFMVIVFLGIVAAVLYALPWLLRAAAIVVWLVAGYEGIITVKAIYAPFSPAFPVLALQFAVISTMVAWAGAMLLQNPKYVWGGLAAGGVVLGGFSILANWLASHWQYANLFFHVLPPALFSVLLIFETGRLRSMRQNGKVRMSVPAFVWLQKFKGGDVQFPGEK